MTLESAAALEEIDLLARSPNGIAVFEGITIGLILVGQAGYGDERYRLLGAQHETQAVAQQAADEVTSEPNEESFAGDRFLSHVLVEFGEPARRDGSTTGVMNTSSVFSTHFLPELV